MCSYPPLCPKRTHKMLKTTIICALMLTGLSNSSAAHATVLPDWTLKTSNGVPVNLQGAVDQRATILLFWATWCPFCKALMPHLQSIKLEYQDSVQILAIDVFDDGDAVAFMADAGYDFTLLLSGDAVAEEYGISGTPGLLIVGPDRISQFDLRLLPRIDLSGHHATTTNRQKAALLALYWAAEVRKSLDEVLRTSYRTKSSVSLTELIRQ